jgi:acetyltransferase-like isoleucine patch superfamily enzyme
VVIVGPVTIGDGAVIGASTVVTHDVAPQTIVAGAPAKLIKRFNLQTRLWERA